jgi:hypothetical protein
MSIQRLRDFDEKFGDEESLCEVGTKDPHYCPTAKEEGRLH